MRRVRPVEHSRAGYRVNLRTIGHVLAYVFATSLLIFAVWFYLTYRIGVVPPHSRSMAPTLKPGDQYLINIRAYRRHLPKRGDVVVFRVENGDYLVKRVIGTPGDWVWIEDATTYLNGRPLREPYTVHTAENWNEPAIQAVVPQGQVFVMGDNRDRSEDSRDFGPVSIKDILGRAERIIFPWNRRCTLDTSIDAADSPHR